MFFVKKVFKEIFTVVECNNGIIPENFDDVTNKKFSGCISSEKVDEANNESCVCETRWYLNGELHRDKDLPAYIRTSKGETIGEQWFIHGVSHRENGEPAKIEYDYKHWVVNGQLHRLDGPASIWEDDTGEENDYYIHDNHYKEEEYWSHPLVIKNKLESILEK